MEPLVRSGDVLRLSSGIPVAAASSGAPLVRPDAPAAAVGLVNSAASIVAIAGGRVRFTFSRPADGRIGFLVVAALWLVALPALPARGESGVRGCRQKAPLNGSTLAEARS